MANILVVDDAREWRVLFAAVLEAEGHDVVVACDGGEALALYDQRCSQLDLVVTDFSMPHMNGLQLISNLKARNSRAHIILVTGDIIRNRDVADTSVTLLQKPLANNDLVDAVEALLK